MALGVRPFFAGASRDGVRAKLACAARRRRSLGIASWLLRAPTATGLIHRCQKPHKNLFCAFYDSIPLSNTPTFSRDNSGPGFASRAILVILGLDAQATLPKHRSRQPHTFAVRSRTVHSLVKPCERAQLSAISRYRDLALPSQHQNRRARCDRQPSTVADARASASKTFRRRGARCRRPASRVRRPWR